MKNSIVTIAVPYYNSSIYLLRKCLDSCICQTYPNIEILVFIDGSPNDLSVIYKDYLKYKNVSFHVSKKNLGVSAQRNKAIQAARGDYILFVDSDDYIDNDMVEKMVSSIHRDVSDVVISGCQGNSFECEDGLFDKRVFFSFPSRFCDLQYTNFPCNKLFRLDIIKKHNIRFNPDVKLGEDAIFCQNYFRHIQYISCIPYKLYHYIVQPTSSTRKYDSNYYRYERLVISEIEKNFNYENLNEQERMYMQYWRYIKVFSIYDYYYAAHKNGKISKDELIENYKNILKERALNMDIKDIGRNQYLSKEQISIARKLNGNAQKCYWVMVRAHGKKEILKRCLQKVTSNPRI